MSTEDGKVSEMGRQLTFLASKQTNPRSPYMEEFWEHTELVWPWTEECWYLMVFRGGGLDTHMLSMQSVTSTPLHRFPWVVG